MGSVVEITIDLTKPNGKIKIETFEITKKGERYIYCKGGPWGNTERRFFIPHMNEVKYRGILKYTYRYQTEKTRYDAIVESEKTADVIRRIIRYLRNDVNIYQKRLENVGRYYEKDK